MALLFNKNKKNKQTAEDTSKAKQIKTAKLGETEHGGKTDEVKELSGSSVFSGTSSGQTHRILKGFYVSEKSSIGNSFNHYTFRVEKTANKSEVQKEVSKLFNVKVKSVKILNMPEKRRDFGKHPGERSGFKKAVVVLQEGFSIGQAKP